MKEDYYISKDSGNELDFRMEDLNEMISESDDSFFTRAMFKKNQIITRPFIPPKISDIASGNDLKNAIKDKEEYRLLFIDFAFVNSTSKEENDNSVIGCMRMNYNSNGKFKRTVDYITTHSASDSVGMERKIRELFWDYKADYIVMDLRNGGDMYFVNLTKEWIHPERRDKLEDPENGWNPHGFTVCSEPNLHVVPTSRQEELRAKTVDTQAIPCIIPIIGLAELNSLMWLDLQRRLMHEEISFIIEDIEFNEIFENSKDYFQMTNEEKVAKKMPVIQTMLLIAEAVSLNSEWKDQKVRLTTPRIGTKDRIVALSYGNYIATLIQNKIDKNNQQDDFDIDEWATALTRKR